MQVLGKCPPEKNELSWAAERGFERVELYLEKKHLEDVEKTAELCRESTVEVKTVHTPHVSLEESEYFLKADDLAEKLDAYLVFHSQYLHHVHIPDLEELSINSPHGFENNPGISIHHLEKTVLDRGNELVLDTAHLYMATENFQNYFDKLLRKHAGEIEIIHLCDSTSMKDGLAFGKGSVDMRETVRKIKDSDFNGKVVLEVMPEDQEEALEKWKEFT